MSRQFTVLFSGMFSEWQFTIESHEHVNVYRAKLWSVDKNYDEKNVIILYDEDLLQLADTVVTRLHKLKPGLQISILWLS